MATTNGLDTSDVVIGNTAPHRLAAWHRAALEPPGAVRREHLLLVGDGVYAGFDRRDGIADEPAEPGRHLVDLTVRDVRAAEAHPSTLGVRWARPVEEAGGGYFLATVAGPDGNLVRFLQAPAGQR